jgi:uncharacterized protein (DUF2147 family)
LLIGIAGAAQADTYPTEFWKNDEQGWVVETKPCDSGLCAYLVEYRAVPDQGPGYVPRDIHNPDPARRNAPLCGLLLMGGFKPSGEKAWDGGWVYDPDSGRTYSGIISVVDAATVKLRGYVGISLFGKTLTLHRTTEAPTRCSETAAR